MAPSMTFPFFVLTRDLRMDEVPKEYQTLALGVALTVFLTFFVRYIRSPFRKLPPGPPGLPILGNALSLRTAQWEVFTKWKKKYGTSSFTSIGILLSNDFSLGDVVHITALGQRIVILNSRKVATDLLDRRGGIYSDRPRNIVAAQILCGGLALPFQGYTSL